MTGIATLVEPRRPASGISTPSGHAPAVQSVGIEAYGGYAATPAADAVRLAQRFDPFRYLRTGSELPLLMPEDEGYAEGGTVNTAVGNLADAGSAAQFLQFLLALGRQRQNTATNSAATDGQLGYGSDQEGGASGNSALGGAMSGNTPGSLSGANYGPTAMGMDGLSPGRNLGMGSVGKLAGTVAGKAIPGARLVTGLGNAFNGAVAGLQNQSAQDQVTGVQTGFMGALGAALNGALGRDGQSLGGYAGAGLGGMAGLMSGMDPGVAGPARAMSRTMAGNFAATGNVGMTADQMSAMPGFGIAGVAGPAASGVSGVGLGQGSAMAFGQGFTNTFGGVGNDGVASYGGTPGAGFGGMSTDGPMAGQEGSQGGNGANGGSQGGNANGGGGAGGGDSYARGGSTGIPRTRGIPGGRFRMGSGLVHGMSGGREDALQVSVPVGSYVFPADVVSGLGQGNTMAGGKYLAGMMPPVDMSSFASGGIAGGEMLIRISPGEFVTHPLHVAALGGSDALDQVCERVRGENAAVAQGMPEPR